MIRLICLDVPGRAFKTFDLADEELEKWLRGPADAGAHGHQRVVVAAEVIDPQEKASEAVRGFEKAKGGA